MAGSIEKWNIRVDSRVNFLIRGPVVHLSSICRFDSETVCSAARALCCTNISQYFHYTIRNVLMQRLRAGEGVRLVLDSEQHLDGAIASMQPAKWLICAMYTVLFPLRNRTKISINLGG